MGAISFSSPAVRSVNAANPLSWMSAVQAVFAFFVPPQVCAHAVPNKGAHDATQVSPMQPMQLGLSLGLGLAPLSQQTHRTVSIDGKALPKPPASEAHKSRPNCLKILREFEPGKCRSSTGRLVISGRMADVCAALDRMAVNSATAH